MNKLNPEDRKNEKGAALVTVLMISLILLIASAGLLLESSLNAANVTDAIAEEQAYVAAESGIQSAVNILRGNRDAYMNTNRLDTSKSTTDPANLINYIRALKLNSSNLSGDTSSVPRLSRWIQYDSTYNDRVIIGNSATYSPRTGNAFDISLSDPDNTGSLVTFRTLGRIDGSTSPKTFGSGADTVTFSYTTKATTTLNIPGNTVSTDIGSFTINVTGNGATITADTRFEIIYTMTDPYEAVRVIRGYLKLPRDGSGNPVATAITSTSFNGITLFYDSPMFVVMGSVITLSNGTVTNSPGGYSVTPVIGTNNVSCDIAPAEPIRILIKSTGYGPRGAKKQLEAIIQKNFFNGMTAPATLTLVGSSTGFVFDPGSSQNVTYSGDDVASSVIIPPVGTDNDPNLNWINNQFATTGRKADVYGTPANVSAELPQWLWSPAYLDATIQNLRNAAKASGNYYNSGDGPSSPGDYATGKGITFIDGDYKVRADGGGILVVTGKLTLEGAFSFKGMIIVTGANGVNRNGGGNGVIQGNMVIAPYNPANLSQPFLSPKYDMSGGGISQLTYDSNSVANGMTAVSNFVIGVAEK